MTRSNQSKRRRSPNTKLIEMRINHGLATSDLAYRIGYSEKTVRLAEAGYTPGPRIQYAIAGVFDAKPLDIWPMEVQTAAALR